MTRMDKTPVGGYVKVIGRIALQSTRPFIVILILLCGFLEAFRNRSVYKGQENTSTFDTINNFNGSFENSIFQIYSFMVGNLQANDMGVDNLTGPNLVTFGIYIIFLFLIPSLAFNIFTGIAINEIQSLMKDCNIQILKDKIDYIYDGYSIFIFFHNFESFEKLENWFFKRVTKVYNIKSLMQRIIYCCTKCRNRLFACFSVCCSKLKVCIKRSVDDVEKEGDKLISVLNQEPTETDLNQMAFVEDNYIENDDKYIENFETLENRAKNLELRLENRTRELEKKLDLIINNNYTNNSNNLLKTDLNTLEERTKTLEDKLDLIFNNNTRIENRTKKLEEKLDLILNNNARTENRLNLELRLEQRNLENKLNTILDKLNTILKKNRIPINIIIFCFF